jgi:hypothetical protein
MHPVVQALLIAQVVVFGGCTGSKIESDHTINEFKRALDPRIDVEERTNYALKLSEENRAILRFRLSSELPGSWDKTALDAIRVLGVVGDADTIEVLEGVDKMPREEGGKFHPAIVEATAKIKGRALADATIPQALRRK